MKIALIGASGFVGSAIAAELSSRGHLITAISRNPKQSQDANITPVSADVDDYDNLVSLLQGHDVVISAFNPGWTNPDIGQEVVPKSKAIQQAVKDAGVNRFLYVGGAGSLYISADTQLVDTPEFPAEYKPAASAVRDYLAGLRNEHELDWAFFSPAIEMHQGITAGRTGNYRLGLENPVFDANGRSILSVEDLAVAIADETETPKHHRQRFTAAY